MISIIVIAFNSLKELKITLPALLIAVDAMSQKTLAEIEVILSDDGSTDGSQAWVQENYPVIRYLRHENLGRGSNRNFGAARAKGDYLIFMDSDIGVEPSAIEYILMPLRDNPDGVCLGNIRLAVEKRPSPLGYYLSQKCEKLMRRFGETLSPWDSYSGFFSIHKKLFNQVNGFSSEFKQYGGEDTEFFLRCNQAGTRLFFAEDAVGWHYQTWGLRPNLRRVYWANYSSAFIPHPQSSSPLGDSRATAFSRTWYDQILRFLTVHRLWRLLSFLHLLFVLFPFRSRIAFYFYHFLFLEYANKGREAGLKAGEADR